MAAGPQCVLDTEEGSLTAELAEFVRARHAALVRRAYLLTGDRAAAEDLVQEALTRTCAAARRRRVLDLEAYTRRVMTNLVISAHRRRRVPEQPADPGTLEEQAGVQAGTQAGILPGERLPATAEPDAALHDAMWRVLQSLSPQQRAVLVLRYYEDLSETEIAAALNVTVGTVRQHASRGLRHLRALITPTEEAQIRERH